MAQPDEGTPAQKLAPLYGATFLFGIACGISLALTPLVLDAAGYDKEQMGTLALFFAGGLVLLSLPVGAIQRRFGPKATLTAGLMGYAASVAAFPFVSSYAGIAAVRFFDGACSICVWVSSETLVLSRSDEKHKAHLTSLYAIWLASGYVVGPLLARFLTQILDREQLFVLAGLTAAAAMVQVGRAVRDTSDHDAGRDKAATRSELSLGTLLGRIKVSCFATFSYGYFQSAVVLFLPLYLMESKGVPADDTIILPGLFCLGMLLFSNLAGRLADRYGHLFVMLTLALCGMTCIFGFVFLDSFYLMCGLVLAAGATLAALSPIALALTGVVVPQSEVGRANSLYNTFYASGILMGPPMSSLIFARHGGQLMLIQLAVLWAAFITFGIAFGRDDPSWRKRRVTM